MDWYGLMTTELAVPKLHASFAFVYILHPETFTRFSLTTRINVSLMYHDSLLVDRIAVKIALRQWYVALIPILLHPSILSPSSCIRSLSTILIAKLDELD